MFADAVKQRPEIRFLQISTDEVYGSQAPDERATESAHIHPNNPYSAAKAGGDLLALAYQRSFDLDILISRCGNNDGPYQFPEKMIPMFVTNLIDGRKVPLYGDGLNIREWASKKEGRSVHAADFAAPKCIQQCE